MENDGLDISQIEFVPLSQVVDDYRTKQMRRVPKDLHPVIGRIQLRNSVLWRTRNILFERLIEKTDKQLKTELNNSNIAFHPLEFSDKLIYSYDTNVFKIEYENFIDYLRILSHYTKPRNALYPGCANDYAFAIAFKDTEWTYLDIEKKLGGDIELGISPKDIKNLTHLQGYINHKHNAPKLPFKDNSFDMIVLKSGGLDLYKDFEAADNLLNDGGYALTTVPNGSALRHAKKYMSERGYKTVKIPIPQSLLNFETFAYPNIIPYRAFSLSVFKK